MKTTIRMHTVKAVASVLAFLLLSSSGLVACSGGREPPETEPNGTTPTTENGSATPNTETGNITPPTPDTDAAETDAVTIPLPSDSLVGDGVEAYGAYPTFSQKGGLYTDNTLTVKITAPEGYTVRYTKDGSVPTGRSSVYQKALTLKHRTGDATVIRAACFDADGKLAGQVITHTYVTVEKTAGTAYTVMLSTDQENLDDMYADVHAKVERAAHAEIVAPDGTRVVSQDVGLRLFGGSSRALAQKSFKIIARKDGYFADVPYAGTGTFTYPFFPNRTVLGGKNAGEVLVKYDGLILRNGGNDSLLHTAANPTDPTLLRDGLANEYMAYVAPHVAASLSEFAVVYLNGEYYGILELRENQNEDYVKRLWGVNDDDVVVIKSELDTSRHCGRDDCLGYGCRFCGVWFYYETDEDAAAQKELKDWMALAKRAAGAVNADEATYRRVYEELAAKVDLENVKEYLAVSCFLCNSDWPYNNVRLWRYTGSETDALDGKWRFATRDMDMAMGRYSTPDTLPDLDNRATVDMFEWVLVNYVEGYEDVRESQFPDYRDALYLQGLFAFLLRDDTFRAGFADYCRTIASEESVAYLAELYRTAFDDVKPLMEDHIARWQGSIANGFTYRHWTRSAGRIRTFIEDRPAIFLRHLDRLLSMYD